MFLLAFLQHFYLYVQLKAFFSETTSSRHFLRCCLWCNLFLSKIVVYHLFPEINIFLRVEDLFWEANFMKANFLLFFQEDPSADLEFFATVLVNKNKDPGRQDSHYEKHCHNLLH